MAVKRTRKRTSAAARVRDLRKPGTAQGHLSIRDLQKISAETIGALPSSTPIKSGDRTVALLVPLKRADPDRLAAVLRRAEDLARGRDVAGDDAALARFGAVDSADWSMDAVRRLQAEWLETQ